MLERGQLTRHDRMARGVRIQEAAHQRGHLVLFSVRRVDPLQEPAEGSSELASLLVWRLIGHGLDSRLSLSTLRSFMMGGSGTPGQLVCLGVSRPGDCGPGGARRARRRVAYGEAMRSSAGQVM